jgi:purine catabolism regulator
MNLSEDLFARGVPHLLRVGDQHSVGLALIPDSEMSLTTLLDLLCDDSPIGLSSTVGDLEGIPRAVREARWALQGARTRRTRMIRYGDDEASSWTVPLEGSQELVEHVLGPLRDYDRTHQTELARTLAVLLRNNRSPTRTAAELFIHRQTLIYRIGRIEELTSRSLSCTEVVVELWLALRAAEVVEGSTLLGASGAMTG